MSVIKLDFPDNLTVKDALDKSRSLESVLVIGFDSDGDVRTINSHMTNSDYLWLLETAKHNLLGN